MGLLCLGRAATAAVNGSDQLAGLLLLNGAVARGNREIAAKKSSFSNDANDANVGGGNIWAPNQTTVVFQRMEETCPEVITAYARCVIEKQNNGVLVRGACEEQFQAVMRCFRASRSSVGGQ